MKIAECMYICLIIAIVHCHSTTKSYTVTRALSDLNSNSSTIDNKSINEELGHNPRVSEISNNGSSNNISERPGIHSQTDVPNGNNNKFSNQTHYVLLGQRRGYLIINRRMTRNNYGKREKVGKAENLLYEEYAEDGSKVYSYSMSSLDDVARFFQYYLNTHICHGSCPLLPTTKKILPSLEPLSEK